MRVDKFDIMGALGLAAIAAGIGLFSMPAGIIAGGVAIIVAAVVGSQGRELQPKKPGG